MIHPDSRAKAHHILVADEAECSALKSQINTLEDLIKLAKTHSLCPSAKIGGDIGLVKPEVIVSEMAEAIFNEPINTLLGPIKTVHGYHLTWVTKRHLVDGDKK